MDEVKSPFDWVVVRDSQPRPLNDVTGSWNFGTIPYSVYGGHSLPGTIIGGAVSTSGSAKLVVTQSGDQDAYAILDGVVLVGSLHVEGGRNSYGYVQGGTLVVKNNLVLDDATITLGKSTAYGSLSFSGTNAQLDHH